MNANKMPRWLARRHKRLDGLGIPSFFSLPQDTLAVKKVPNRGGKE